MNKEKNRIAILGAGGAGVCTALELAQRGYKIDLYDENSLPVSRASFVNEGKIHLGFIYAKDKSLRTAKLMIEGSLHFIDNLKRWIDIDTDEILSTPFYYCVHRGSLLNPAQLSDHYARCIQLFDEARSLFKKSYLGQFDKINVQRLSESEVEELVNPEYFEAVFSTTEHAVDPQKIAIKLRDAVDSNPKIHFIPNTKIQSVEEDGKNQYMVKGFRSIESFSEGYNVVLNATWHGRLQIDRPIGIVPLAKWSYRYKFGNRISIPLENSSIPSCTCVQGPFGDIVNFRNNGMFLSWYPTGRTGWSTEDRPPEWDKILTTEKRFEVFSKSFDELKKRFPSINSLNFQQDDVHPAGGVIYAYGTTDVDDVRSKLHERFNIGIQSKSNYHSINTGKYTLVPYWGVKLADRIEGKD